MMLKKGDIGGVDSCLLHDDIKHEVSALYHSHYGCISIHLVWPVSGLMSLRSRCFVNVKLHILTDACCLSGCTMLCTSWLAVAELLFYHKSILSGTTLKVSIEIYHLEKHLCWLHKWLDHLAPQRFIKRQTFPLSLCWGCSFSSWVLMASQNWNGL